MEINLKQLFKPENTPVNQKIYTHLLKAIAEVSSNQFDYVKFRQSVKSMMDLNMDEETAVKSAFTTASVMGITKADILTSAERYKTKLNKEREEFALSLKNQIAHKIDGKRVESQKAAERIEANLRKIENLKKENELLQGKIDDMEEVIKKNQEKIESTRDDFKNSFDILYDEINNDIILIDKHL